MTALRMQHIVPAMIILGVAALVAWLSFTEQPSEAFLFPRVISVFFLGLAGWNAARAVLGLSRVGEGVSGKTVINILPGLIVALVFVFFIAETLGFYTAGTLAFFAIYTIYDPTPLADIRGWLRRIVTTAIFMAVIYGLFSMLLQVQTPRGMIL